MTCPACARTASYPVAQLLALQAPCAFCATLLRAAGENMRQAFADAAGFGCQIEVTLALEDELGIRFSDAILEACDTPRDLALRVAQLRPELTCGELEIRISRLLARVCEGRATEEDLTQSWAVLAGSKPA